MSKGSHTAKLFSLLLTFFSVVFYFALDAQSDYVSPELHAYLVKLQKNEDKAFEIYQLLSERRYSEIPKFVDKVGVPAWKANQKILTNMLVDYELSGYEKDIAIPFDMICEKRIQQLYLYKKYAVDKSPAHKEKIDLLAEQIDELIERIYQGNY